MIDVIANCVAELGKAERVLNGDSTVKARAAAAIASIQYVSTVLSNASKAISDGQGDVRPELRRVLNALALELPAAVHQDAAGRILWLFERQMASTL